MVERPKPPPMRVVHKGWNTREEAVEMQDVAASGGRDAGERPARWNRGLPPGPVTQDMLDSYEVYFSPIGWKWHRLRTPDEKAAAIARRSPDHA